MLDGDLHSYCQGSHNVILSRLRIQVQKRCACMKIQIFLWFPSSGKNKAAAAAAERHLRSGHLWRLEEED